MQDLAEIIDNAYEQRHEMNPDQVVPTARDAINTAIDLLNMGHARIAEKTPAGWQVNQWLKKAVLLYFRVNPNRLMNGGFTQFYDKVPLKFNDLTEEQLQENGVRIVPPACVRHGAYIAKNTVLMPSLYQYRCLHR